MGSTYSFADVSFVFTSPSVGQKQVVGQAIGTITVQMTDNNTDSQLASDGVAMTSKIVSKRGTISFDIQQIAPLNNWLLLWYNAIMNGDGSIFTEASISIKENFADGRSVVATGVSPQKIPDHNDSQKGGTEKWEFVCQSIVQSPV
jgi:hypothetical protein